MIASAKTVAHKAGPDQGGLRKKGHGRIARNPVTVRAEDSGLE